MGLGLGFGYSGPWLQWTLAIADGNPNSLAATRGDSFASLNRDLRRVTARRAPRTRRPSCPGCAHAASRRARLSLHGPRTCVARVDGKDVIYSMLERV